MGKNPTIAPIALAITGSLAFNNVILNVDEIQNAAHQVQWAVDTTEQYLTKFAQAMKEFENAPASGYNNLIKAAETMAVLVHSEMKGMSAMSDAVGGGLVVQYMQFLYKGRQLQDLHGQSHGLRAQPGELS